MVIKLTVREINAALEAPFTHRNELWGSARNKL